MTGRQKFDGKTKICVKCKENIGNIIIRYSVYCKYVIDIHFQQGYTYSSNIRTCFFTLVQTRFRKTLEPSINPNPDGPRRKALKAAGSLVIGLSGGTSSITVLDLVAKTYFAPRSTADGVTEENLKKGKEHPRNTDKRVWKGTAAVGYVEVCGAFPEVRISFGLSIFFANRIPAKRQDRGDSIYCRKLSRIAFRIHSFTLRRCFRSCVVGSRW